MDFLPKKVKTDDFEVTGVSRSGRVRKKSSKLMDFESSDDIEKPKRTSIIGHRKHDLGTRSPKKGEDDLMKTDFDFDLAGHESSDFETEPFPEMPAVSSESMDESQSDYDEEHTGFRRIDEMPTPTIYTSDKTTKKRIVIKDGKVVTKAKAPPKEKGKAKVTAYMLWARETRAKIVAETPKLDFASISKRLSELWSLVTTGEKDAWQRRAKRLNSKQQPFAATDQSETIGGRSKAGASKFITNSQPGRGGAGKVGYSGQSSQVSHYHLGMPVVGTMVSPDSPRSKESAKIGITPIDVAAHLKLLGESLTLIGERLKEHEGQIAVSGSLSVLLDSLLCALGPLLCLTTIVPELQEDCCTPDQLMKLVDNVAFIMPGL